ncbi:pre-miRNA 5'-monophosphate methyltransferase-like [Aedes albopictus]|uniref:RNA methyltransferase n=1 Tax=Aedes albopictus TaxID=7160 RepID=A0ABM1Y5D6_AEDAL
MSNITHKRTANGEDEIPSKITKRNREEVRHGSYQQYYEYRSQDSRPNYIGKCLPECLKKLSKETSAKDIYLLDIGCNSGKLTHELLKEVQSVCPDQPVHGLGVDIDEELVERATVDYGSKFLEFDQADISSMATSKATNQIEKYLTKKGIKRFDFICCFSVLMYIHLNHGDDGLKRVLDYVCSLTEMLVLELQGWKKYRDHARRMRRSGGGEYEHYETLEWRGSNGYLEQQISDYVACKGFTVICNSEEKNEFNREVVIYARNKA